MIRTGFWISAFCFALTVYSSVPGQKTESETIPTLTYSQLFNGGDRYMEKLVRVKAIYTYGFEWAFLCDSECDKRKTDTWLDFNSDDELCRGSKGKLRKGRTKYFDNKAEVTFVGRLSAGGFGHLGAYD